MTDEDGNFEVELPSSYKPGTDITLTITDEEGTTASDSVEVLPIRPSGDSLRSLATEMSGVVDANAKVTITLTKDDITYTYVTKSDANGDYKVVFVDNTDPNNPNPTQLRLEFGDQITGVTEVTLEDGTLKESEVLVVDLRLRMLSLINMN